MKKIFKNLLLLFATVAICLLIFEAVVRIFFPQNIVWTVDDEALGYRYIPNTEAYYYSKDNIKQKVKINSEGFRDVDHKIIKDDNVYRIAIIGDSYVAAFEVPLEKTFFRLLQQQIDEIGNKKIEILSFGVAGFGTDQEYLTYREYVKKYDPDMVILAFVNGNDIRNNDFGLDTAYQRKYSTWRRKSYFKFDNDNNVVNPDADIVDLNKVSPLKKNIKRLLKNNFQSSTFVVLALRNLKNVNNLFVKYKIVSPSGIKASNNELPLDYNIYLKDWTPEWESARQKTASIIKYFNDAVNSDGSKFMILDIPTKFEANEGLRNDLIKNTTIFQEKQTDFNKISKLIKEMGEKENIEVVSLLDVSYYADNADAMYYRRDGHWTRKGHKAVARILKNRILDFATNNGNEEL